MIRAFDKNNYIDFRDSFRENFNRIIIIDLKYNLSDFNSQYNLNFNEFKIESSQETKKYLRERVYKIEDYQLVMFFQDNKLIRYQELINDDRYYHFSIYKSKEYKDIYTFIPTSNKEYGIIPYEK